MARKSKSKNKLIRFGRCSVQIKYDRDWEQYRVIQKVGGKVAGGKKNGGYFTDDRQDARNTAASIIKKLRKRGICR